jgi:hypothetical protein
MRGFFAYQEDLSDIDPVQAQQLWEYSTIIQEHGVGSQPAIDFLKPHLQDSEFMSLAAEADKLQRLFPRRTAAVPWDDSTPVNPDTPDVLSENLCTFAEIMARKGTTSPQAEKFVADNRECHPEFEGLARESQALELLAQYQRLLLAGGPPAKAAEFLARHSQYTRFAEGAAAMS